MSDPHASTVPIRLRPMGGVARYSGSAQTVASRCGASSRLARPARAAKSSRCRAPLRCPHRAAPMHADVPRNLSGPCHDKACSFDLGSAVGRCFGLRPTGHHYVLAARRVTEHGHIRPSVDRHGKPDDRPWRCDRSRNQVEQPGRRQQRRAARARHPTNRARRRWQRRWRQPVRKSCRCSVRNGRSSHRSPWRAL